MVTRPSGNCQITFLDVSSDKEIFWKKVAELSRDSGRRSRDRRPTVKQRFLDVSSDLRKFEKSRWTVTRQWSEVTRLSADCQTTIFRRFKTFFKFFSNCLKRPKKRCLTVSRRSRDLRPLSRDRSATFFKIFLNRLKRPKNVVWQSADGRVTPTTVAWPFSDFFQNFPKSLENVQKPLFDSRPTVAWPQPLSRDRSATFFKIVPNRLKRPKNVVWQSADGRVTSDHCRVTVQRRFSNFFLIAWNVQKTLFDSQPTVAWPPTTVAWPFSDFFQNFPKSLETSKKRCLTVGRRSRDPNHCRVTVQRLFSKLSQIVPKNVVWQSADGRVTSDHCRVTVQRLFSKIFLIAWNVQQTLFDSRPTVAWPQPLSRDRSATFSKFSQITWNVQKTLFDSRPTVAWPQPLSRDRSATFFKFFSNCLKRPKTLFDSRPTVAWPQPLSRDRSATFFKIVPNRLKRPKTLFDSRPTVAWPPTTVAWPFSAIRKKFEKSRWTVTRQWLGSRDRRPTVKQRFLDVSSDLGKFWKSRWAVTRQWLRSRDRRPTVKQRLLDVSSN